MHDLKEKKGFAKISFSIFLQQQIDVVNVLTDINLPRAGVSLIDGH